MSEVTRHITFSDGVSHEREITAADAMGEIAFAMSQGDLVETSVEEIRTECPEGTSELAEHITYHVVGDDGTRWTYTMTRHYVS
ncbi:hypothetical protein WC1_68 [Rhodococcus phage WC1]|uniref:Uncharacterized protein n=5 Tax=Rerduovirus TaxID=1982375 RepID=G9FHW1_9CAUD|nr:hypothetical protein RoPhRER2_gp61 [Rhodococcus phage RER2]YP_009834108.1 hypothetical protein HWB24_gp04 [Rhodococcus phage Hiro]YP_010060278.1 hypothetical protein KIJ60_gp04 [Rhodococcus phage PhailMary]AOQ27511.1 hypothetical protein SEA_NATOSALEDA_67 [Rhodococcus phage Natosaleda]AOT23634.1 hypothetical protein SEA_HARLEQUIN_68 [Rhodococcus phage Harlequin]AOZ62824.1 hypothetical protein SEA_YOGI_69 [Rhodococcus phage Yogi]AQP30995.1 hypothetical protein SEA_BOBBYDAZZLER_68 [Rhodococc